MALMVLPLAHRYELSDVVSQCLHILMGNLTVDSVKVVKRDLPPYLEVPEFQGLKKRILEMERSNYPVSGVEARPSGL